jgi:hypothetical protein
LGRFIQAHTPAGQNLIGEPADQHPQQGDLIAEDDAAHALQLPAFGGGEVLGVEAVLDGVGVAGLPAPLSAAVPFCCR